MNYLLDTNILRETLGPRPDLRVLRRITETPHSQLFTSAVCLTELRLWSRRSPDPGRRWQRVEACLKHVHILPFEEEDAVQAGDLVRDLERAGKPLADPDVMIAATAIRHGCTLVSRNVRHFARVPGLRLENWFE